MRFPSVAVFTVTALVAGGLTAQATENPSSEHTVLFNPTYNSRVIAPNTTANGLESLAILEKSPEQPWLQSSTVEFPSTSTEPTSSSQEAVAQVEALEGAILAEVSNPDINPPTLPASNTPESGENVYSQQMEEIAGVSQADALRSEESISESASDTHQLVAEVEPQTNATCSRSGAINPDSVGDSAIYQLAQAGSRTRTCPRPQPIVPIAIPEPFEESGASPALSIYIPVGYGADQNTVFLNGNYQASVREDDGSVGAGGIGIGVGNADKAAGLELSYALETTDDEFGEGGFNAKLHRRFGQDLSAAIGWNGFLNIGRNDFEQSKYGVITKIFRTQDSLNDFFSRVAVTVGVGDGQFRSNGAVDDGVNNVNVFGNVAIRVARPVSFIAEWTGQDLGLGLSIAPFKNIPFVITPAVRDIAGAGDDPRFVIGAGTALRF
ncbi:MULTISPECIES: hypothetical protein [unclassified Coleofasciculus]|uniref:hypothetical protein n=1 Tax=unclassified Coleofasciculus TaxID=2692782 RepID=UPI001882C566|nr:MULTISPECIES: hypothetical protein [unclassified Coleofasciculus]MBE9127756.1 hypothetical protein [Coleofasciculus sp. LEGE 07081]MBE9149456.1 hypothetical protein [Coleofasciculus sp. LEGE 07092]